MNNFFFLHAIRPYLIIYFYILTFLIWIEHSFTKTAEFVSAWSIDGLTDFPCIHDFNGRVFLTYFRRIEWWIVRLWRFASKYDFGDIPNELQRIRDCNEVWFE